MSIFVDRKTTQITLRYVEEDGKVRVLRGDAKKDGEVSVTFEFRKPSWGDTRKIMGSSAKVDGEGNATIDTYKFMDATLKTLMVDWDIKGEDGKKATLDGNGIDELPFEIVGALFEIVSEKIQMPGK
jgi:hypothetical protein